MKYLIIVESPAKINKLKSILGSQYEIISTLGHIMDLNKDHMAINFDNNFEPEYEFYKHKRNTDNNSKIKKLYKECDSVIIASDLDREGEFIAESVKHLLKLKSYERIVFNEITKKAILNAIASAGKIDYDKVHAQQARRFIDRIFGYGTTPLLKHIPQLQSRSDVKKLGCGRVQSIIMKLIIDKEKEIKNFFNQSKSIFYEGSGLFQLSLESTIIDLKTVIYDSKPKPNIFNMPFENDSTFETIMDIVIMFMSCAWKIIDIKKRTINKAPNAPHITSTLQCESASSLNWSIKRTMEVAQKLYESGYITYMRTDSTLLSDDALNDIESYVITTYGKKYYNRKQYITQSDCAQEAHEAIRPTHVDSETDSMTDDMKALYKLIWSRAVASQMSKAEIESNQIFIEPIKSKHPMHKDNKSTRYLMVGSKSRYIFKGYTIIKKDKDKDDECDDIIIPESYDDITIKPKQFKIKENVSLPPQRYNEAQMVKTIEKYKIGRPSTFVNMVSKIQEKDYARSENTEGKEKKLKEIHYNFSERKLSIIDTSVFMGKENKRLVPTELGIIINNFLVENFPQIMQINFSAELEKKLDLISKGDLNWINVLNDFYNTLKPQLDNYIKLNPQSLITNNNSNNLNNVIITSYLDNDILFIKNKFGFALKYINNGENVWVNVKTKPNAETAVQLIKDRIENKNQTPKTVILRTIGKYIIRKKDDSVFIQYGTQKNTGFCSIYNKDPEKITIKECKELVDKHKQYKKKKKK